MHLAMIPASDGNLGLGQFPFWKIPFFSWKGYSVRLTMFTDSIELCRTDLDYLSFLWLLLFLTVGVVEYCSNVVSENKRLLCHFL